MNGTVVGREINQVAVVVVWNGYAEVSVLVGEGSGGSPEVCGKNRNKRRIHVAIVFADHEGMVGGNAPSLKHVGFSPPKSVCTYVGCGIIDYERVVWRASIAVTNEKNLIRRNTPVKTAKQKR